MMSKFPILDESGLRAALAEIMDLKAVEVWLNSPNSAFDGLTPLQVIQRGESDRIWRMIWGLREGNLG